MVTQCFDWHSNCWLNKHHNATTTSQQHHYVTTVTTSPQQRHYNVTTASLRHYSHYIATATSLQRHYNVTTASLHRHSNVTTTSLQRHNSVTTSPQQRHNSVTTSPQQRHYNVTTASLRHYSHYIATATSLQCHNSITTSLQSLLGMLRSIGRRSVSADHHILWLDRYSYIWAISCTDCNLMMSALEDIHDAWGHKWFGGVEMLWRFEKQWKIRYMWCMFCMMIWWMDCSFLTADSVRADLRITARVSTGAGADRGRSMNIYL